MLCKFFPTLKPGGYYFIEEWDEFDNKLLDVFHYQLRDKEVETKDIVWRRRLSVEDGGSKNRWMISCVKNILDNLSDAYMIDTGFGATWGNFAKHKDWFLESKSNQWNKINEVTNEM